MKPSAARAALGAALALLVATPACEATTGHRRHHQHLHGRPFHAHAPRHSPVERRGGTCQFPTDEADLVAITPDEQNAGWAMSPNQQCEPGGYCPVACKPGMVMAQWDPAATSYTYPLSMVRALSSAAFTPFPCRCP